MKTRILTQADIRSLVTMEHVVPAVEQAFAAYGRRQARMPAKVYLTLEEHGGDFRAMPAYLDGSAGVKWVNSHPDNPARHGLPAVMGMYILSDAASAAPLAVMDATWLTALRTGAAGAVASKYLAVGSPRTLGFVGCGVQARVLLDAHRVLYADLELRMADANAAAAERFAQEAGGTAVSIEEACACDIVCTSTPVRAPVVRRRWIREGTHINAMGADAPGKQELEHEILVAGTLVVDDMEQATHSGEINVPFHDGVLTPQQVHATLGDIVIGKAAGRRGTEITVFDSTGLAIQDLALARAIYELATERGVGHELEIIPG